MKQRLRLIGNCCVGCVVGSLIGLWFILAFDTPILAVPAAGLLPVAGCWVSGLRDPKQLAKIGAYATVGWGLTFVLGPATTQSAGSHARRIAALPLVGQEWHIAASVASTLFAIIGVAFSPLPQQTTIERSAD